MVGIPMKTASTIESNKVVFFRCLYGNPDKLVVFVDVYLFGKGPYSGCMLVFGGCNRRKIDVLYTIYTIRLIT